MFGTDVRATRLTWMWPDSGHLHAGLLEADARGVRDRADGHQAVAALDGAAVGEGDEHAVARALDLVGARLRQHRHAAALEHLLEDGRGIRVLTGKHLIAAGDERDLRAEVHVGATANSAPVTPEPTTMRCSGSACMSYSCVQVRIRSPSGLAVGSSRGDEPVETTRVSASMRSKSVPPGPGRDDDGVVALEPAVARDDPHARLDERRAHVVGLLARERQEALVDRARG